MNINKLKQEIEEQSRNGRDRIYVDTETLKELGVKAECEGRVFIELSQLNKLIKEYEEKDLER